MSLTELETAEVNFIELLTKVKHDRMVPFVASIRIPCQVKVRFRFLHPITVWSVVE